MHSSPLPKSQMPSPPSPPLPLPTNWLSFSLSPLEMLTPNDSHFLHYDTPSPPPPPPPPPHYYFDHFYSNVWTNPKSEILQSSTEMEQNQINEENMAVVPKLEDFFQTEAQDSSSLTQFSDYFNDQQDLKAIAEFQAFSATNSGGSEVDDSASAAKTPGAHSVESPGNEFVVFSGGGGGGDESSKGTLSLGGGSATENCGNNAIAVVKDSGVGNKKVAADTFGQRTSAFRGVTRHRWTGRYEAHLWDNSCRREGQARKGRQVYLGGYDKEEKAARAYDLAALKYWGPTATTNFPVSNYTTELEEMEHAGKQEFIASLRRKSSGFSRGASIYRGVTRHHQQGRWQARIGRVAGNKDLYLGTFATEEEAAEAYDIAAIKFRGLNAVTNFEMSRYDVEAIMNNSLPVGGTAKRLKLSLDAEKEAPMSSSPTQQPESANASSSINFSTIQPVIAPAPFDSATAYYHNNLPHHSHPTNTGNTGNGAAKSAAAVTMPDATALTALPAPPGFYIWSHQSY